jgi:hypothetical protein
MTGLVYISQTRIFRVFSVIALFAAWNACHERIVITGLVGRRSLYDPKLLRAPRRFG